jgi:hypothetical protein
LGLGPKDLEFSQWPDRCAEWMVKIKIISGK